jgi:hypothetical protein
MRKVLCSFLFWAMIAPAGAGLSQTVAPAPSSPPAHEVDLAFIYSPQSRQGTGGTTFWAQGGSVELSADVYRGFGVAADFAVSHASNITGNGINLTTFTPTVGPRYTWSHRKLAIFGEGLVGVSDASSGVFPATGGAQMTARSFAAQMGGGMDLRLSGHIALRPVEASWLRTQFPNGTTNVQNTFQLGAGVVFRLPH